MSQVDEYLNAVSAVLGQLQRESLQNVVDLIMSAYRDGKQVFIIGNGGSSSTASHMACDLQKTVGLTGPARFKVMALTDSIPLMTAWANDFDYSEIFSRQLATWLAPGDLVIAFSGSGNSPNILGAVEYANRNGGVTIGFSGFEGGRLAHLAQHNVIVPSSNMQHIEDVHVVCAHLVFRGVLDQLTHGAVR